MLEIWKEVDWYSNYHISNYGRVKSLGRLKWIIQCKERLLKPHLIKWYYRVTLCIESTTKHFQIHRLVATHFINNNQNKPCVNHINGNKWDNKVENLEWCTYSENEIHSYNILGKKARKGKDNVCSKAVSQYDLDWIFIASFWWMKEAERKTWIPNSSISACSRWIQKVAGWFIWKLI